MATERETFDEVQSRNPYTAEDLAGDEVILLSKNGEVRGAESGQIIPRMYVGQFGVSSTGTKNITGLGFKPTTLTFRVPSGWSRLDESTKDSVFGSIKPQGNAHGFARLNPDGTIDQQSAGSYGGQTNSNNSRIVASSTYGVQWHLVDTDGNIQARGEAEITSMDSDGFTLNVVSHELGDTHRIFFEAYRHRNL